MKILFLTFILSNFGVCAQNASVKSIQPGIYLGLAKSGTECSVNSTLLSVRNTFDDKLLEDCQILSFEMILGKLSLKGTGGTTSKPITQLTPEMQNTLKAAKSGSTVVFILKVQGSDSIARMIAATFTVK